VTGGTGGRGRGGRHVTISDDDVPDAVYIDGDLSARRSGSSRVVIVDDDVPVTAEGPRDVRRRMEGRIRDRRISVKRQAGRRRLTTLIVAVAVAVGVVGGLAFLGSSWFGVRISDVRVTGNVYADPGRLAQIIEDVSGTPVILVDTDEVERSIEKIPWVKDVSVRTDWPFGLIIDIRERSPVVSFPGPDGLFRVLDADGRVLDVIDGWPFEYLLMVTPDTPALGVGEFAPLGPTGAATLADTVTPAIRDRISLIEVDAGGSNLVVTLDDGTTIRFGAARELFPKLVRLETVMSAGAAPVGAVIDVSTDEVTVSEGS
jgi:cell division protein FtsQ